MVRPRTDLVSAFRDHWTRYFAPPEGSTLVAAVSGGIDSMVLLSLLVREQIAGSGVEVVTAHFDHGMRGDDGAADGRFVSEIARAWGSRVVTGSGDVPAASSERRSGPQATARDLRYAFLGRVVDETGAFAVVTAHQRNDRAETVLLRLIRGTSPGGLAGPRPIDRVDGLLVLRPMLAFSRPDIETWAEEARVPYRADPSNDDARYPRTRIRKEVLPLLTEINPRAIDAIVRLSALSGADAAFLADEASRRLQDATESRDDDVWTLAAGPLVDLPAAVLGRIVIDAWSWGAPPDAPAPTSEWVMGVVSFLKAGGGGAIAMPGGGIVRRMGSNVEFHRMRNEGIENRG